MRVTIFDIETVEIPKGGPLAVDTIWCIVCKEVGEEPRVFTREGGLGYPSLSEFKEYARSVDLWVAHNGSSFDVPVVNNLMGSIIDPQRVVDTFVVSRLVNYSRFNTHSLEELGAYLKEPKTPFADWSHLSQEMVDYCIQDVVVNEKIYNMYHKYIWSPDWSKPMRIEHDMVLINNEMSANGFKFNVDTARELLSEIKERMSVLEEVFQKVWPPYLEVVNTIQYRVKQDGELYKNVSTAMEVYPKTEIKDGNLLCYDYVEFNPGSTKDRVEKLWEAGWNPTEKTKTHFKFERTAEVGEYWGKTRLTQELYDEKKAHFDYYGWTVGEENLRTLPVSAPEGASRLAEWLTLEGRRSSLTEWLQCVSEDGRIHGKFWNIGAWTHRMSHSNPNQANIFSPFHGEPRNAVEEVKDAYDGALRALWCVDEGSYLVGTDADGIQLRILAHYMQSDEYVHAIVSGKKEDETDIHNLNRRKLALNHITRDSSKTFIYAYILGAGTAKIARILETNPKNAKAAVSSFTESLPGLKKLRKGRIPFDARRGYFEGLDGRKVLCDSDHLMLAGYLQNGEAVIMKHANRLWLERARKEKINFKQVDFVHDEWQVQVDGSLDMAERLGEIQRQTLEDIGKELNLYCPLAGSTDIGFTWKDTH